MQGARPSLATQPFSRRCCTFFFFLSSPPSPLLCLLPALLVLFSCSVCSPLVVPAPWLYLARPHAPLGFCPVFRPVGRPGRPPQTPLRGDSPFVLSRWPPPHQFPDGRAGRPVRLNAGHRHGASQLETLCSFVPLLAPCSPHLPRPAPSTCPSCVPACSAVVFFPFVFALSPAPARPACAPCSSPCHPCPAALRRLTRLSPPPSPSRCRPCLHVCPPCLSRAVTHVCHPRALPLPLPVTPTFFPRVSPSLVLPQSPSLTPSWLPCALCGGGGVYLRTGLWPCPRTGMAVGFLRTMSNRMCRRNTETTSVDACRIPVAAFALWSPAAQTSCGPEPPFGPGAVTKGSYFVAPCRCPMAPAATKAWRGQPLRAGHA